MKLSKVLLTVAAAALVIGFAGCKADDNDSENAIKGSNKSYSIDYTNTTGDLYRCYNGTNLRHSGGTFKITMKPNGGAPDGVMGIIWDLHDVEETDKPTSKSFFIVGTNYNKKANKLGFYCSKFTNVTDIQAENFGTELSENKAEETAIEAANKTDLDGSKAFYYTKNNYNLTDDDEVVIIVDVQPTDENKDTTNGGYTVTLYDSTDVLVDASQAKFKVNPENTTGHVIATFNIDKTTTGYDNTYKQQNDLAVYANIQKDQTLTGTWKFGDIINELVVEEE